MPTLVIGANLPDVDALATLAGADAMYGIRRGWTHGVLAMALLPFVLVGVMLALDRLQRKKRPDLERPRSGRLLALAYLSVWSHPFLDWLNNYGVRLLMPFDGTWFYGDAIFIVDPWMWLSMAAAVVLANSKSKMGIGAWSVLGLATTGVVVLSPSTPLGVDVAWLAIVAAIVFARARPIVVERAHLVARTCVALLGVYIALMLVGTSMARSQARAFLERRNETVQHLMAGPLPANPFVRDVIAVTPNRYLFLEVDFLGNERFTESHPPIPRGEGPEAEAAMASPEVAGFKHWLRFPSYRVESGDGGYRVHIGDVRYTRTGAGIGHGVVELDERLRPLRASLRK